LAMQISLSASFGNVVLHRSPTRRSSDLTVTSTDSFPIRSGGKGKSNSNRSVPGAMLAEPTDLPSTETVIGKSVGSASIAPGTERDRKSTRLNSSHLGNSYAVYCLKKKKI